MVADSFQIIALAITEILHLKVKTLDSACIT
jgi:hypothetical protein